VQQPFFNGGGVRIMKYVYRHKRINSSAASVSHHLKTILQFFALLPLEFVLMVLLFAVLGVVHG
jgi:hypothetical protein